MTDNGESGLSRTEAAAWVTRRTRYRVAMTTLRNWERSGLLRNQLPGKRVPCAYGIGELIAAEILAMLRRDGASLQRVRRALRELARLIPDILRRPGSWRLAVDGSGQVVRVEDSTTL